MRKILLAALMVAGMTGGMARAAAPADADPARETITAHHGGGHHGRGGRRGGHHTHNGDCVNNGCPWKK